MNKNLKLFLTAVTQVMLVSMNVVFISHSFIVLMLLTGFGISWTWSYNIKRIAISTNYERLIYASGASTGTGLGYYLAKHLITIL